MAAVKSFGIAFPLKDLYASLTHDIAKTWYQGSKNRRSVPEQESEN